MLRRSLEAGFAWITFEPNTPKTWDTSAVGPSHSSANLYTPRGCSLEGMPSEAFFVKCDAETNPPEQVDNGLLVCDIGVAPVSPAEFIMISLVQTMGRAIVRQRPRSNAMPRAPARRSTARLLLPRADPRLRGARGVLQERQRSPVRDRGRPRPRGRRERRRRSSSSARPSGRTSSSSRASRRTRPARSLLKWREYLARTATAVVPRTARSQLDTALQPQTTVDVLQARWPCKWEISEFDASKSELAIETLELAHDGITFDLQSANSHDDQRTTRTDRGASAPAFVTRAGGRRDARREPPRRAVGARGGARTAAVRCAISGSSIVSSRRGSRRRSARRRCACSASTSRRASPSGRRRIRRVVGVPAPLVSGRARLDGGRAPRRLAERRSRRSRRRTC